MTEFIILLVLVAAGVITWRLTLRWQEEKLRKNPPERKIVEVSLPRGTKGSPAEMARFYRKIASFAQADSGARRKGLRQLDFVYFADVVHEGAPPRLRCFLYADEDVMEQVKRALKSTFRSGVDVAPVEEDDLRKLGLVLRPPEEDGAGVAEQEPSINEVLGEVQDAEKKE